MTPSDMITEFRQKGALCNEALAELKELIKGSDPYEAITLAADCGARDLAPEIVKSLESAHDMVRWNAIGALYTRFKVTLGAKTLFNIALCDESSLVRAIALCGIGEILFSLDPPLRTEGAAILLHILQDQKELAEVRAAAIEGILASIGRPPHLRPPATRITEVADLAMNDVEQFKRLFLPRGQ